MKLTKTLIAILALSLLLTACNSSETPSGEQPPEANIDTTQAAESETVAEVTGDELNEGLSATAEDTAEQSSEATSALVQANAPTPPPPVSENRNSVDEFWNLVQNNGIGRYGHQGVPIEGVNSRNALRDSAFSFVLVPRIPLDGFTLTGGDITGGVSVVDYGGGTGLGLVYTADGYRTDNRFNEHENNLLSRAAYSVQHFDERVPPVAEIPRQGRELLNIGGKSVLYNAVYSTGSRSEGELLGHNFVFVEHGLFVEVFLPAPAVDGLSVEDMGRFLRMERVDVSSN